MPEKVDIRILIGIKRDLVNEIQTLEHMIGAKRERLKTIRKALLENCEHDWEVDFIDQMKGYVLSKRICYCTKCEVTVDNVKPFSL